MACLYALEVVNPSSDITIVSIATVMPYEVTRRPIATVL
jgi:hypothetical protein